MSLWGKRGRNCNGIDNACMFLKGLAYTLQVIGEFCKTIGADSKQKQGLIRLAKKNGEKLGFLA